MQLVKKLLSVTIVLISIHSSAQQFGGNPPSLKWNQINTDTVRVIFPKGLDKKASEVATIAARLGSSQFTLGNRMRKISIVLQNQTTYSNGYVGLGPRRSEFYLTPLQNSFDLGSLPWHQQLALHEFRHVQQFNNFNKGVSKLFYVLAGELGVAFANSAAVPNWFWEGDAVFQETNKSEQGRGRLPNFFNPYRSLWSADKKYSWMKLRNGSYRDYVPNHYHLGYLFTAYGRQKYGDDIWGKITDDAVRFKPLFFPFQGAIRKYTGKSYKVFRKEAFEFYEKQLSGERDSIADWAGAQKDFVADQEYPQWINDEEIVMVESSYRSNPWFTIYNTSTKQRKKIRIKDISADNHFSYRNNRIVYAASSFDPRWGWRDYSDIRLLDLSTGEQKTITRKTKYFAPDISDDGAEIVAVEVLPEGSSSIQILNVNGALIQSLPNPDQLFFTYPRFYKNGKIVSAVRNSKGEMALGLFDRNTGDANWIVPFSNNVIGFPFIAGDTISFTASYGEQDKLFVYTDGRLYKFNSADGNLSTGSYQLSLRGGKAAWVDFTAVGHKLTVNKSGTTKLQPVEGSTLLKPLPVYGIKSLSNQGNLLDSIKPGAYSSQHYSKAFRLLNFHSWLPAISDPDYTLSFIAENVLNTLQAEVYGTYNRNEESKKIGVVAAYGALYPWIRVGGAYTKDRSTTYNGNPVRWDEAELRGGLLIPFNFSGGKNYRFLRVGTDYVYAKPEFAGAYKDTFDNRAYGYINSYLTFSNQSQQARQHIFPRFAQSLRLEYNHGVTKINGNQFMASGLLYLPGIHVNHNVVFNVAWQRRDTLRQIAYTNNFPFSRGYDERSFHQMIKLGANYHLPLLYPDWGFGNIVYFLRVRANLFYDLTHIMDYNTLKQKIERDYRSYGAEINFDTKWWNQQPVSFGIRYSRLVDGALQGLSPNQWEFIVPVNLINR